MSEADGTDGLHHTPNPIYFSLGQLAKPTILRNEPHTSFVINRSRFVLGSDFPGCEPELNNGLPGT
jgi:hypothetical protein